MIRPKVNDIVLLRDNRLLNVTDVAEEPETIMIGYVVHPELYSDPNLGEPGYEPINVVTDLSEVVSILE